MGDRVKAKTEKVARASYGRLVAVLSARFGDIEAAEDALTEAFGRALEQWPEKGIPEKPEAWLLTVSRNLLLDEKRSAHTRYSRPMDDNTGEQLVMPEINQDEIEDERLKLLFVCSHPAISADIHAPLMLQTVFGFDANAIATAFMLPGATLAQRLVRAKRKIKNAGIAFKIPNRDEMPERLASVLEAIYGAYSINWETGEVDDITKDARLEATYLADIVVEMLPNEPEALGLAALLSYSYARRGARLDGGNRYVPLGEQDVAKWDRLRIRRANVLLARAQTFDNLGRFQLEAAIQAVHAERVVTGKVNWRAIAELYTGLVEFAPTVGAVVGKAAAFGKAFGAEQGLAVLGSIDNDANRRFQPYWATRASLLEAVADKAAASEAYEKAISLATDIPTRSYLESKHLALKGSG